MKRLKYQVETHTDGLFIFNFPDEDEFLSRLLSILTSNIFNLFYNILNLLLLRIKSIDSI